MSLTQLAIDKNRVTLVLVTLLLASGLLAYGNLPKEKDPGFIVRTAVITTQLPGASPERMELLVTDKIEKKVQEMPEVDFVTSESRTGISIINVNFLESYKEMRPIFDDLRRKVDDIARDLPNGVDGPTVNDEFGDVFGSVYTLTGDGYSYAELEDVAEEIRDRLLKIPEIAKVTLHGVQEERIFVEYNNARLAELGLSPQQLSATISSANILSSGGNLVSGRERIVLEPTGNFESVDDLARTVVPLPSGSLVYLGDIAKVYRDYVDPPRSVSRVNGVNTLAIAISMREGGDILKLGAILDREVPRIEASYPWGIDLEKVWFQATLVEASIDDFTTSLLQAIGIVILVMIFTLKLRTGLVVASLIPSTMVITFFLMQSFGITINQVSLAALIIALGLLVDNAIVVVESVLVKREGGASAIEAAAESGRELMLPLLVSSLTTAAAFMPIALAESAVGEFTADIFYVVTLALLTSWMLAMTFVPLLTTKTLRVQKRETESFDTRTYRAYRALLTASLKNRVLFGIAVVVIFFTSIWGLGFVPAIFIAPSEDPVFSGKFEMPLGTSIETSQEVMADIDRFIERTYVGEGEGPRIHNWLTFIGDGGPRFELSLTPPNQNAANSFLVGQTVEGEHVDAILDGIGAYAAEHHPDLQVQLSRIENGPPVGYPIQVRISGPDLDGLYRVADEVTAHLNNLPDVQAVKNSWGLRTKKLVVEVDQERARLAGVSSEDVATSLKASLAGIDMTQYREQDTLIPVVLRSVAADR
ncbi:MAG: efflux RND transporter permease subunit, partial [Acidobacteriota bacterium]